MKFKSFLKALYKVRFYFDISNTQVSWIVGKGPELMSAIYILEKLGVVLVKKEIIFFIVSAFFFFVVSGVVLKASGVYDIEQYVAAEIQPVQKELLEAARKINRGGFK